MNALQKKYPDEVGEILDRYPAGQSRSAVMPLLFLAQRASGYIDEQAIADIADLVKISTTDVGAVAGFYTLFHLEPGGHYRIQVCTDLPCALRGADDFLHQVCEALGVQPGQTTPDGLFTIEEVKCVAACHRAPVFQVQGDGSITFHEHQTLESALQVLAELRTRAGGGGAA